MTEYKKTANTSKPAIINLNNYVGSTIPRNLTEKTFCNDNLKKRFRYKNQKEIKGQQKNFIFVWPPKQTPFYYKKEVIWAMWAIAHMVYWLNVVCLFPSGQVLPFKEPRRKHKSFLAKSKPDSRDFIIEPDWNSYG